MASEIKIDTGNGNIVSSIVGGENNEITNNKYLSQNDQSLFKAVAEIKQLIEQLSQNHSMASTTEQMKVATQAIETIENNPVRREKAIAACKQGLLEAIKTSPVGAFVAGAIEGWTNENH